MPNTPDKRPDVEAIKARVKASYTEGTRVGQFTGDVLELIAWIEALEERIHGMESELEALHDEARWK